MPVSRTVKTASALLSLVKLTVTLPPVQLPMFPPPTVLFPGVLLPLHIHEERYKALLKRCLADQIPFGVVLIKEGREVGGPALGVRVEGRELAGDRGDRRRIQPSALSQYGLRQRPTHRDGTRPPLL